MQPKTIKRIIYAGIILIIVIIDIFVILHLNKRTRDVQVLSEIKQIRSGLELFLQNNDYYPQAEKIISLNDSYVGTEKLCADGFKRITELCDKTILNPVPNYYFSAGNNYSYQSTNENKDYQIEFNLLTNFNELGLKKGKICANSNGLVSQPCF